MLINRKAVKQYAYEIGQSRAKKFSRVSQDFLVYIEAKLKENIKTYVLALPSKGKTIK